MKMWQRVPFIVILSILPGCASQSAQPAAIANPSPSPSPSLDSVRVCLIVDPRSDLPWAGSGVPIGDNSIATCLHVLRLPVSSVSIDGQLIPVEVSASGGTWHSTNPDGTIAHGDDWGDVSRDWLQFTARAGTIQTSPDSSIDFNRPVDVGEPIFLIGFAGDASRMDRESVNRLTPTIVAGRVVKTPSTWQDRIIAVELDSPPDHEQFGGMSGGAAAVYDDAAKRWVVVGIVRGSNERRYVFGPFNWSGGSMVQVVRPPMPG